MLTRAGVRLGILAALVTTLSCTSVPRFVSENEGGVALVPLKDRSSIPLEWGSLVAVTANNTTERGTPNLQLWFQDKDDNIREAVFDPNTNQLLPNARLFRRK